MVVGSLVVVFWYGCGVGYMVFFWLVWVMWVGDGVVCVVDC